MGICPRCGSFVDEGEPYCPDCSYIFGNRSSGDVSDTIEIDGYEFDRDEFEEALDEKGYDLRDLELGFVDEEDLEEIIDMLL